MSTTSVLSRRYDERAKARIEMSRTGVPTTVQAARGDQTPRISGPAAALHGALGGIYGAAAMSILRLAARRAGVIDKMVPQVVEEWTLDRTGMESSPASKTAHHVLDLTNLAAIPAYGLAVQLLTEEPPRQPDRRPTSDEERHAAHVG